MTQENKKKEFNQFNSHLRKMWVTLWHVTELRQFRGTHDQLNWLHKVYKEWVIHHRWEYATHIYLLHLVRCTIFVDKSVTYVNVSYLLLFNN